MRSTAYAVPVVRECVGRDPRRKNDRPFKRASTQFEFSKSPVQNQALHSQFENRYVVSRNVFETIFLRTLFPLYAMNFRHRSARRLLHVPGFSIDRIAAAAGSDPEVLRLENLDTDLPPPRAAIEATRRVLSSDDANSYLPFIGSATLRRAVARHLASSTHLAFDPESEILITCGGTEGMFDALLATTDPGDEVLLTDPTYAGMINRVRLTGAVPRFVPFRVEGGIWRFDCDALRQAITPRARALFLMNPSMPSGAVLAAEEWEAVAELCCAHDLLLLYNAAMERILYDNVPFIHPATLPGMRERTIIIGSVSKEFRMIGWRIGWVVATPDIATDIARVHIYNVVTPTGIAQEGAAVALESSPDDFHSACREWQRRRDAMMQELEGFPFLRPQGGWSLLLDVGAMGFDSTTASHLLLERGKIAATPMKHWGERNGDRYVRFVFSNEPVERICQMHARLSRTFPR